jgi:hypothetical protein
MCSKIVLNLFMECGFWVGVLNEIHFARVCILSIRAISDRCKVVLSEFLRE